MKLIIIVWNVLLAAAAVYGLCVFVPHVYAQARYQFTSPGGGPSMWPATFGMFVALAAYFSALVALSHVFNRKLGFAPRVVAAVLAAVILIGWIVDGQLWVAYMGRMPGVFQFSALHYMLEGDEVWFFVIALLSLTTAAIAGCGPLALIVGHFQKTLKPE